MNPWRTPCFTFNLPAQTNDQVMMMDSTTASTPVSIHSVPATPTAATNSQAITAIPGLSRHPTPVLADRLFGPQSDNELMEHYRTRMQQQEESIKRLQKRLPGCRKLGKHSSTRCIRRRSNLAPQKDGANAIEQENEVPQTDLDVASQTFDEFMLAAVKSVRKKERKILRLRRDLASMRKRISLLRHGGLVAFNRCVAGCCGGYGRVLLDSTRQGGVYKLEAASALLSSLGAVANSNSYQWL